MVQSIVAALSKLGKPLHVAFLLREFDNGHLVDAGLGRGQYIA